MKEARIVRDGHRSRSQSENGFAQIVSGEIAGFAVADNLGSQSLLTRTAQNPNGEAVIQETAGEFGVSGTWPALRRPDGSGRERYDWSAPVREATSIAPSGHLGRRNFHLRKRPCLARLGAARQRQHGAAVHHPRQFTFAKTHVVEEDYSSLAEESDTLRNAGEKRRERRFPGARHDECGSVTFAPKAFGQRILFHESEFGCAVDPKRLFVEAPACSRQVVRTASSLEHPLVGRDSAAATASRPSGNGRNLRSTCKAPAGWGYRSQIGNPDRLGVALNHRSLVVVNLCSFYKRSNRRITLPIQGRVLRQD